MDTTASTTHQPMIFVTGASRSGTTLVGQVLGRHSQVAGLRETQYFGGPWNSQGNNRIMTATKARQAVTALLVRQGIQPTAADDAGDGTNVERVLAALAKRPGSCDVFAATMNMIAKRAGKRIPCDQTPRNIYYAKSLLTQFPDARVVHLLRDPRAVLASQKSRWRKRALQKDPARMSRLQQIRARFNYHPYTVARLWNRATHDALQLQGHPRFHILRFEYLLGMPEKEVRNLCAFLQLDFEPGMLDVEHTNSSFVASTGRPVGFSRLPIDTWPTILSSHEVSAISERCATLMERVGYYPTEYVPLSRAARYLFALRFVGHVSGALILNPRRLWIQARAIFKTQHSDTWQPAAVAVAAQSDVQPTDLPAEPALPVATSKSVFGLLFTDISVRAAATYLVTCARKRRFSRVVFVNAHCLNVSVADAGLQRALQNADIVFADGVGMLIASAIQGQRLEYNVNGTDLFPQLCDQAAAAGVSIGFLGGAPGVADRCVAIVGREFPALHIAYSRNGFFDSNEDADILSEINASGVQILLVAMGVPLQDRWISEHSTRLTVPIVIGVGALLDFVSGGVPRAPSLLRTLKLEWLFRLSVEPRRLFSRYVLGNPLFLIRAVRYAVTRNIWNRMRPGDSRGCS